MSLLGFCGDVGDFLELVTIRSDYLQVLQISLGLGTTFIHISTYKDDIPFIDGSYAFFLSLLNLHGIEGRLMINEDCFGLDLGPNLICWIDNDLNPFFGKRGVHPWRVGPVSTPFYRSIPHSDI